MNVQALPRWLVWLGAFGLGLAACGWIDDDAVESRE